MPKALESLDETENMPGVTPSRTFPRQPLLVDVGVLLLLIVTIVISARDLLFDPVRSGLDTVTFSWPVYAFLGDQLKSGTIPGWNPYQFSGVPFLADPESGWWYAPAMLIFGALPFAVAIKIYATVHILIAGLGTYAYGRVIGMAPAGALIAAWAVSQGGLFTDRSRCCYAQIQLAAWIPIALLAIELAIRSTRAYPTVAALALGGFAISQMLAGWIGQGAMYGLLLTGAYVAFRTLATPQHPEAPWRTRIIDAALQGLIPLTVGIGLSAPGSLPRLLYLGQTNLANGYTGSASWAAELGGWTAGEQIEQLVNPSGWYVVGTAVLFLASVALGSTWRSGYTRFFAALSLVSFVLGLERHTIVHNIFFTLVPGFKEMHTHFPDRIALVLLFGPAMLAGIAFTALQRRMPTLTPRTALLTGGVAATGIWVTDLHVGATAWITAGLAIGLLTLLSRAAIVKAPGTYKWASYAFAILVITDLQLLATASLDDGSYLRIEGSSLGEPNQAANFIRDSGDIAPPRFFGYDPALSFEQHGETTYYRHNFENEMTFDLLVNNRGTLWRIADIQGYNPLQLQRYVDFIEGVNGASQEYHGAYILPKGLTSPLIPLLSPTYIVIPNDIPSGRSDLQSLVATYPEVASTSSVRILRYTGAMPRAWIVHEAVVAGREEIPSILTSENIDFRTSAVLETGLPVLDQPAGQVDERAEITSYDSNRITVNVMSDGRGLLVLSETYADGWSAHVDGQEVDVLPVDLALRGITVPGGSHSVVLTFEPPGLEQGFAIFGVTILAIAAAFSRAVWIDRLATPLRATPDATPD